jgi:hypothetical protein
VRRKAPKRLAFSAVDRLVFETPPVRAEFLEVCNPGFGSPLGALQYAGMPAQVARGESPRTIPQQAARSNIHSGVSKQRAPSSLDREQRSTPAPPLFVVL